MNIYKEIARCANELESHPLMEYFRNTKTATPHSFQFVPQMAFFVLGFKDILATTYSANPTTELEKNLNIHCEEDADHWLWFLEDLTKLGELGLVGQLKNKSSLDMLSDIWSVQGFSVRRQTYSIISLLSQEKCSEKKLVIVECLESAFSAFITNLNCMTKSLGLYESLKYFGREHHFDESQHSMGSWIEGDKQDSKMDLNGQEQVMVPVVRNIFTGFHEMFDVWYAEVDSTAQSKEDYAELRELDLV